SAPSSRRTSSSSTGKLELYGLRRRTSATIARRRPKWLASRYSSCRWSSADGSAEGQRRALTRRIIRASYTCQECVQDQIRAELCFRELTRPSAVRVVRAVDRLDRIGSVLRRAKREQAGAGCHTRTKAGVLGNDGTAGREIAHAS